jgi:hypothetical protein
MTKKTWLATAGALLIATVAMAGSQNDAGCGLGSILLKEDEPAQQILAATTNGTSGNQTFGITTGTLGCKHSLIKTSKAQENFVAANFKDLNRQIAAGNGEYVSSLSGLLGCAKPDQFAKFAQSKYEVLFPTKDTTPEGMLNTLKAEITKDPTLATSCSLL